MSNASILVWLSCNLLTNIAKGLDRRTSISVFSRQKNLFAGIPYSLACTRTISVLRDSYNSFAAKNAS